MINKFGYRAGIVALTLCLIFAQAGLAATVNVNLNDANQTIRGFGGMNFPRWIGTLTNAQVDTAFGNGSGQIGLTIMRIDIPPDSGNWSGQVAAAQRAINNHGAIVFASPWTPPASMKTNGQIAHGELKTDSYDDFANWLTDFADYMSSNGAPLYAVSVQNEPDWDADYESCIYSAEQMRAFLDSSASVIPVRVIAPERTGFNLDYMDTVAASPECDIVAIHIYGGGGYYSYPGKEYWMTEHYTDSTTNANVWPNALGVGKEIHDCMTNNMNAYIWWYIRRSYGPIDESGNITKRGYCMSHFAKFVRPGYIRVDATANPSSGVYVTAYKSDANLVIVAVNQNSSSSDVTLTLSGGSASSYTKYQTASDTNLANMGSVGSTNTLAANSINTFVGTISSGIDIDPPTPDPMTWATAPAATGQSTITMTASTATDANSPPVQYYFECTNDGYFNSSWQSGATYVASGLTPNTSYSFRVRARDSATTPNVTGWSSTLSATTQPPDTTPPSPNPMTWASAPSAVNYSSITMTATTATDLDSPPVQYYFECTTDGTKTSGWQSGTTYLATGLTPLTLYSFRVKAHDNVSNETGWSSTLAASTPAQPTDINIIGSWLTGTNHAKESGANRALIFIAHGELTSAMNLTGVTYGGQAMTKVIDYNYTEASTYAYAAAFILKDTAITAASSTTFTPTWSATPGASGYSSAFLSNVDQTSSIGATGRGGSTSTTVTTSALSTSNGDMVIFGATCGQSGTYAPNNSFTEGNDQTMSSTATGETAYKRATGAAETPSTTWSGSSSINRQMIIGFVLKAGVPVDLPPAAPIGFTATAGNQIVSLNWNDNSESDMNGYNVYRSTTSGTGYVKLNGSLLKTSDYNDNSVVNGTTYYYVVTAVDLAGHESVNSIEVSAKPNYQNCAQVIAASHRLLADLAGTGDCYVNFLDFTVLAGHWLDNTCTGPGNCDGADFDPTDGVVDIYDLSDFANQWLSCNDPANPNCTQNW